MSEGRGKSWIDTDNRSVNTSLRSHSKSGFEKGSAGSPVTAEQRGVACRLSCRCVAACVDRRLIAVGVLRLDLCVSRGFRGLCVAQCPRWLLQCRRVWLFWFLSRLFLAFLRLVRWCFLLRFCRVPVAVLNCRQRRVLRFPWLRWHCRGGGPVAWGSQKLWWLGSCFGDRAAVILRLVRVFVCLSKAWLCVCCDCV